MTDQSALRTLDDRAMAALDALAAIPRTMVAVVSAITETEDDTAAAALQAAAQAEDHPGSLDAEWRTLAALFLRHVMGDITPADQRLELACDSITRQTAAMKSTLRIDLSREQAASELSSWSLCAGIVREVGLEELDVSAILVPQRDGTPGILAERIPRETAHVWLLEPLFDRIETFVSSHAMLDLERSGSAWYFERWTPRPKDADPDTLFAQSVREQEWSLVERLTLSLDASATAGFCDQPEFSEVPPRQQRLARALRRSFSSAFAVQKIEGTNTTLRDLMSGRECVVHEHRAPLEYTVGFLALGRLIPFGPGRYLRSPGMVFFQPPGLDAEELVADGLRHLGTFPPALAIEALLSTLVLAAKVPRVVKASPSREDAVMLLEDLTAELDAAGLRDKIKPQDLPDDLRGAVREPLADVYGYRVDEQLAEWMAALGEQARPGKGSGSRRKRDRKKRRKSK